MNEVIDILTKVGAVLPEGHFVGASGLHFDTYVNKDFLYPHTKETSRIGRIMAEKYKDKNIEVVIGPAMGGIILAQWTAFHLSEISGKDVLGIYTEKTSDGGQVFTRGYDGYVKDKRVLVVEDIVTTGGSLNKTIKSVQEAGGNIIAACAMVNKNADVTAKNFTVPFDSLSHLSVFTYDSDICPLCKNGVPMNTQFGHGKKFLESFGKTSS